MGRQVAAQSLVRQRDLMGLGVAEHCWLQVSSLGAGAVIGS